MRKLDPYQLAFKYLVDVDDRLMSVTELGIIYSILPELLIDLQSNPGSLYVDVSE